MALQAYCAEMVYFSDPSVFYQFLQYELKGQDHLGVQGVGWWFCELCAESL